VSPGRRGLAFAAGALVCAGLAAATGSGGGVAKLDAAGELRPVVVVARGLPAGGALDRRQLERALELRRVPTAFAPPDALADPAAALGRRLAVSVPAGSYLTASLLRSGGGPKRPRAPARARGTPVEVTVAGAGALATGPEVRRVDVVVAGGGGPGPWRGRPRLVARGVPLLDLRRAPSEPGLGVRHLATLALRRDQALRLIRAEATGRTIRLLAAR